MKLFAYCENITQNTPFFSHFRSKHTVWSRAGVPGPKSKHFVGITPLYRTKVRKLSNIVLTKYEIFATGRINQTLIL